MSKIRNFFMKSGDRHIFCSMIGEPRDSKVCMLIFLPLFEERMWSQRVAFNFALKIAENGNPVLMWDYYGYGESDGDSEDFTLHDCCKDTRIIIEYLKSEYRFSSFNFLGIRTGCGIACHVLSQDATDVEGAVFWAPVIDLKNFIFNALRSTITTQSFVFKKIVANRDIILSELMQIGNCSRGGYILNHIDGYRIGKKFYEEILYSSVIGLPNEEDISKLYLDVLPKGKEALLKKIKDEQEEKLMGIPNTSYVIETDKEFWVNSMNYDQTSEKLYSITMEWLKSAR